MRTRPGAPGGLLAACLLLPSVAWAQGSPSDARDLPNPIQLSQLNLVRRWQAQVPVLKGREEIASIKVREGLLFASSTQGLIHCLDAETGARKWSTTVSGLGAVVFDPAIVGDFVYVTTGMSVLQLSRDNGRILWTKELPAAVSAGAAANEKFVYVPATDRRVYAIALTDEFHRKKSSHPIAWYYDTGGAIHAPPIVLPSRVVAISNEGTLYASTLNERKLFYRYYVHSPLTAPVSTLDRYLYLAANDSSLHCIELTSGTARWRLLTGYPIYAEPLPFVDDVFVTPEEVGLYCVDNKTGVTRWRNDRILRIAAVSQEHVYGLDRDNNVVLASRSDGHEIGIFPGRAFSIFPTNQFNDRLYLATKTGLIVCMNEKQNDKPYLHRQKPPEAEEEAAESTEPTKKAKGKSSFFDELDKEKKATTKLTGRPKPKKGDDEGGDEMEKAEKPSKPKKPKPDRSKSDKKRK